MKIEIKTKVVGLNRIEMNRTLCPTTPRIINSSRLDLAVLIAKQTKTLKSSSTVVEVALFDKKRYAERASKA